MLWLLRFASKLRILRHRMDSSWLTSCHYPESLQKFQSPKDFHDAPSIQTITITAAIERWPRNSTGGLASDN
jgi:hypothetical protein